MLRHTFDIDEPVEEPDGSDPEQRVEVLEAHLERVAVVELQVHVDVEAQVRLDLPAQRLQQALGEAQEKLTLARKYMD